MAQGKSEKQGGRRAINKLQCHPEVLHLVDPLADAAHQMASMKRPTANVSGDNPGDSAPVAGDERNQTLIHLGVAPPHVFSPDWLLQYGYLGNAPLLAITDVFHFARGTRDIIPPCNTLSL